MGEYLTSNQQVAYPFCEDAAGIREQSLIPLDLVVDGAFEHNPGQVVSAYQAHLSEVQRVSSGQLDLTVLLDNISLTLSATLDPDPVVSSDTPWILCGASQQYPPCRARLVLSRAALISYLAGLTNGQSLSFGISLPFEPSTLDFSSLGVNSLVLWNHGPADPLHPGTILPESTGLGNGDIADGAIQGDIAIGCGNNISVDQPDGPAGDLTTLQISAVPGAGTGTLACDPTTVVVSNCPAGLTPASGNIQLKTGPDGCYQLVPAASTGTIQIQGHCQACCTCDDYEAFLTYLSGLCDRVRALKLVLDDGRTEYETGVARFNSVIAPQFMVPLLKIYGYRGPDWAPDSNRGSPNWFRGVIQLINQRNNPITIISMVLQVNGQIDQSSWTMGPLTTTSEVFPPPGLPVILAGQQLSLTALASMPLTTWLAAPGWTAQVTCTVRDTVTGAINTLTANTAVT